MAYKTPKGFNNLRLNLMQQAHFSFYFPFLVINLPIEVTTVVSI
ncbi:MAG TPA: hypothetical protein PKL31_09475 [Fulvivirga sp.]|nr:hypothetical protein [Fulvivirga sp.]